MAITQNDINDWQGMIDSGDRAGFYYEYYKASGTYAALAQASITTYNA